MNRNSSLPNIPVVAQDVRHERTDVISQWVAGRVAIHKGDDLTEWGDMVGGLARDLETELELKLNHETGIGFARANQGFPLEMIAYSDRAKEWAKTDPVWRQQHGDWTNLFHGEGRGIC